MPGQGRKLVDQAFGEATLVESGQQWLIGELGEQPGDRLDVG
ncbi:hypothetical protein [Nocardia ignorata]|nr:hypothetical protein [Nocardia ignorata]